MQEIVGCYFLLVHPVYTLDGISATGLTEVLHSLRDDQFADTFQRLIVGFTTLLYNKHKCAFSLTQNLSDLFLKLCTETAVIT